LSVRSVVSSRLVCWRWSRLVCWRSRLVWSAGHLPSWCWLASAASSWLLGAWCEVVRVGSSPTVVVEGSRRRLGFLLFALWTFGLQSLSLVCGLFRGSSWWWWWSSSQDRCARSSFVAARIVGSLDSGSWIRVPLWWVGVCVTARGGQVPGQTLSLQLNYPPRLEDQIKTRRGPFTFGVCVSVVAPSSK